MREQFYRAQYNYLIKNNYIYATFHYHKVKITTFDEFFRCMAYLG